MKAIKVYWYDEVGDDYDNNSGYLYGIYTLDDDESVIDTDWYQTEELRDIAFNQYLGETL